MNEKKCLFGNSEQAFSVVYHFWVCISLIFLCVVGLDGLGLDDDGRVAAGERTALGGDGARDVARGQSQCHRHSRRNRQCQILNRLHKALFLNVC